MTRRPFTAIDKAWIDDALREHRALCRRARQPIKAPLFLVRAWLRRRQDQALYDIDNGEDPALESSAELADLFGRSKTWMNNYVVKSWEDWCDPSVADRWASLRGAGIVWAPRTQNARNVNAERTQNEQHSDGSTAKNDFGVNANEAQRECSARAEGYTRGSQATLDPRHSTEGSSVPPSAEADDQAGPPQLALTIQESEPDPIPAPFTSHIEAEAWEHCRQLWMVACTKTGAKQRANAPGSSWTPETGDGADVLALIRARGPDFAVGLFDWAGLTVDGSRDGGDPQWIWQASHNRNGRHLAAMTRTGGTACKLDKYDRFRDAWEEAGRPSRCPSPVQDRWTSERSGPDLSEAEGQWSDMTNRIQNLGAAGWFIPYHRDQRGLADTRQEHERRKAAWLANGLFRSAANDADTKAAWMRAYAAGAA